jgi:hypothetical protein
MSEKILESLLNERKKDLKKCPQCNSKDGVGLSIMEGWSGEAIWAGCILCDLHLTNRTNLDKLIVDWNRLPRKK